MSGIQIEIDSRAAAEHSPATSTIAIAATFTAEPLKDSLDFWIDKLGLQASIEFAPYNHVMQSLLDMQGPFSRNKGGLNVVLMRLEDWYRFRDQMDFDADYFEK